MNIHPKVQAVGIAGAITTILVFGFQAVGITFPADVIAAFTTIVAFAAGYLTTA